jgi:hypothetical protein
MDTTEKSLKLETLQLALDELDLVISRMKENNYSEEKINEYVKRRWNIWNEIYQVKKS